LTNSGGDVLSISAPSTEIGHLTSDENITELTNETLAIEQCLCISRIHNKESLPLISSTETNDGCNSTAAWISLAFANSTTTFAECEGKKILSGPKLQILIRLLQNNRYVEKCYLPPQQ